MLERSRAVLIVVAVALAGAYVAVAVAGAIQRPVGPFDAQLSLHPSLHGQSVLEVPPLGDVRFRTHSGPVRLEVRVRTVRPVAVARLADQHADLREVGDQVRDDLQRAVLLLVLRDTALAVGGAALAALLLLRAPRPAFAAAGCALAVLVATSGVVAATFSAKALTEPEFTGALTYAPAVIGDARDVVRRLDDYSRQLGGLVTNVVDLYGTASTLPTFRTAPDTVRLLHVSDLHLSPSAYPLIKAVAKQFDVDVVLDTGDVTDHGSSVEDAYVSGIAGLGVPYVYVRGNHDSVGTEAAVRSQPGTVVLDDGYPVSVAGLTIMGQADPRFTPDKRTKDDTAPKEELRAVGRHLLDVVETQSELPDIVAVHDPISAEPLIGHVPLVLAGHTHERDVTVKDGTRLMVEGSTGGAGLRALEGDTPTPVEMTVLYFDGSDGTLQAYDEITLGGLGLSDARIRRQVVTTPDVPEQTSAADESPPSGSPAGGSPPAELSYSSPPSRP